jgi:hypothetical protein
MPRGPRGEKFPADVIGAAVIGILAIAGAFVWAFIAGAMGAPIALISFGAFVVVVGIVGWGLKGNSK